MTNDDRLFGYRLQLFDLAGRTSVSEACRTFGIHGSTYCAWRRPGRAPRQRDTAPRASAGAPRCRTSYRAWSKSACEFPSRDFT